MESMDSSTFGRASWTTLLLVCVVFAFGQQSDPTGLGLQRSRFGVTNDELKSPYSTARALSDGGVELLFPAGVASRRYQFAIDDGERSGWLSFTEVVTRNGKSVVKDRWAIRLKKGHLSAKELARNGTLIRLIHEDGLVVSGRIPEAAKAALRATKPFVGYWFVLPADALCSAWHEPSGRSTEVPTLSLSLAESRWPLTSIPYQVPWQELQWVKAHKKKR